MGLFSGIASSIASSAAGGIVGAIADPITKITQTIVQSRVALEAEKNNAKRLEIEEQIKALESKRDVLIAESGDKTNRTIRALMALPVVVYLWKLIVFDKVFGYWLQWRTDPLSSELTLIVMTIIGFYFVDSIASRFKR